LDDQAILTLSAFSISPERPQNGKLIIPSETVDRCEWCLIRLSGSVCRSNSRGTWSVISSSGNDERGMMNYTIRALKADFR